jgi:hypothetical protein
MACSELGRVLGNGRADGTLQKRKFHRQASDEQGLFCSEICVLTFIPMPDTVITSVIAGVSAIVAASMSPLISSFKNGDKFVTVGKADYSAFSGEWVGLGSDTYVQNGSPLVKVHLNMSIKAGPKKVTAKVRQILSTTDDSAPPPVLIDMKGGFFNNSLVQLAYTSQDRKRMQYGVLLMKLDPSGDAIIGHYAGFSPVRQCLICGEISLRRAS